MEVARKRSRGRPQMRFMVVQDIQKDRERSNYKAVDKKDE